MSRKSVGWGGKKDIVVGQLLTKKEYIFEAEGKNYRISLNGIKPGFHVRDLGCPSCMSLPIPEAERAVYLHSGESIGSLWALYRGRANSYRGVE